MEKGTQGGVRELIKLKVKEPRRYKVIFINDDFTPMDFVVMVLTHVFHKSVVEAETIMLAVHEQGQGVVGVYSLDEALTRSNQTMQMARAEGYPLRVNCEPE